MHNSRIIDHTVHRPCEEGINVVVRVSDVQRSSHGVELVSSSNHPGHWPWSITVKATSFANTLSIQIRRAHRNGHNSEGEPEPRTGWRHALLPHIPGAVQQQQQQQQGHGPGLHAHHHQHHHHLHQAGNLHHADDGNQSDDSDEHEDDPLLENINIPALLGEIRRGELKLSFDPNRYRWISIYSPLRQAEIASQEYRKDASFQENVKEHAFYHFQVWFSSALRIPRLLSSSLSRLQQAMLRLRKDKCTANVCIKLVDPEDDDDQGHGEPGARGTSDSEGAGGHHAASGSSSNHHGDSSSQERGPRFPDRCFPEYSTARNKLTPDHGAMVSLGARKRSITQESSDNKGPLSSGEVENGDDIKGKKKARHVADTSSEEDGQGSPSSGNSRDHAKQPLPLKHETRAADHDMEPESDEGEEEVVVFAHKSVLEGDPFFNRLLSSGFHEAVPDNSGLHIIKLSREFFPTKQIIDIILDFVYAEVITIDLMQPLHDHALASFSSGNQQQQHQNSRRYAAPNPVHPPNSRKPFFFASDCIKANVFQCVHGLSALELVKVAKCPSGVLQEARRTTCADKAEGIETGVPSSPSSDTLTPVRVEKMFTTTAATTSDNVRLPAGESNDSNIHQGSSADQNDGGPFPTRCQEQLVSLTQLWDDLYGAAHFMQNEHLQLIALSQLQLDQRTTLARAMNRGCMFQEVEQAMHDYLLREKRPIFGNPQTNQLKPYFLVDSPFQMAFLLSLTSSMAYGGGASM
ncbi:hypothetical protein BGZ73_008698 [Actinomortierella ambigua]|nr:hypothetical protein BGZ73_008698 [Actinomortierella ambigua]